MFLTSTSPMILMFLWRRFSTRVKFIPGKMVRILNVAEKNDAAKSLATVLSKGQCRKREGFSKFNKIYEFEYRLLNQQVMMTMTSVSGHLLEMDFSGTFKKWGTCNPVDLFSAPVEKFCPEKYTDIKRTLEKEAKGCQSLIIWTDCDREGENIGFEIIQVCQAVKPGIKVYRAKFSEITPQAVARAVNNLTDPDARVNDAVDVRQELDLRIGAAFTRFQTLRLQKIFPQALAEQLISYGSCQFPTLGFVVERYKQVQEFVSEPFWKIRVAHQHDDVKAEFHWKRNRLFNFLACEVLFDQCVENPIASVVDVQSKSKSKWRPQALDTVELEKVSSLKLKINAKETMRIAEKLYTQGFISYPRTETNIFPKGLDLVPLVEEQTRDPDWGAFAQQVLDNGPNPRNGTKTDQAHPPIHPLKYTDILQGNERKVYEFIVRRFLACVSKDAEGHETVVEIDIAGERFSAQGLMIFARHYLDVYPYEKWYAKEIPQYQQNDQFKPNTIEIVAGETCAPPLLSEADLISLMEKHGIGTDATHAEHIETVKSRMYVGLKPDGRFVPGQLGMGLVEGYDSMGYEMSKPNLRSELEADLKLICQGRKAKNEVLEVQIQKYKEVFTEACRQAQKLEEALSNYLGEAQHMQHDDGETSSTSSVVMTCPLCQNLMTLQTRKDGKGYYIGCSNYPNCRASIWLPDFVIQVNTTAETCHICQPGPVSKLKFKFKPGSVPPTIPNNFVGCVGGCDEMLNETLGIHRLTARGNSTPVPHTERTAGAPVGNLRNTASNDSPGQRQSSSRNRTLQAGSSLTRSFHSHSTQHIMPFGNDQRSVQGQGNPPGVNRKTVTNHQNSGSAFSTPTPCGHSRLESSNKSPFSSLQNVFNSSSTMHTMSSSASAGTDKAIVCNCGNDALLLTVRKEGPNTGRQFYKCSGQSGGNCNFFLWADDSYTEPQNQSHVSASSARGQNNSRSNLPSINIPSRNSREQSHSSSTRGDSGVLCKCQEPAKFLTVLKDGPNKDRPFYACSKPRHMSCQFFQWADDTISAGAGLSSSAGHNQGDGRKVAKSSTCRKRASSNSSDGASKDRKPRSCGYCGQQGHTKPKCPERVNAF